MILVFLQKVFFTMSADFRLHFGLNLKRPRSYFGVSICLLKNAFLRKKSKNQVAVERIIPFLSIYDEQGRRPMRVLFLHEALKTALPICNIPIQIPLSQKKMTKTKFHYLCQGFIYESKIC